MADLSRLKRQRGHIQAMITTLKKIIDTAETSEAPRNGHYIKASLQSAQKAFENFDKIQSQIEELDDKEIDNRAPYVQGFNLEVARAQLILDELAPSRASINDQPQANTTIVHTKSGASLPSIPVPMFDGSPENWYSFFNLFEAVLKEFDLPPVKKLHFLRTSLNGKAASAIESLELIDENYEVAVSILKGRYESVRRMTHRHWSILREYPRLQKDSASAINQLVDTFNQHTRALENLKAPVSFWDIPLVDLIQSKLNSSTIWHWELTLTDDKIPCYKDLLKFLEKRAICGDNARTDTPMNTSKQNHLHRPQTQTFYSNNNSNWPTVDTQPDTSIHTQVNCPICNEQHCLYTCEKFRALTVEERHKVVAGAKLCFNCFGKNHAVKSCLSKGSCRTCSKRHNTLLHFEKSNNTSSNVKPEANINNTDTCF